MGESLHGLPKGKRLTIQVIADRRSITDCWPSEDVNAATASVFAWRIGLVVREEGLSG